MEASAAAPAAAAPRGRRGVRLALLPVPAVVFVGLLALAGARRSGPPQLEVLVAGAA
ncbi:MAG: hypothetical protein ABR529_02760 [Actinomycetota bacterium]